MSAPAAESLRRVAPVGENGLAMEAPGRVPGQKTALVDGVARPATPCVAL